MKALLFDRGESALVRKRVFEFEWDSRAGPVLLINIGDHSVTINYSSVQLRINNIFSHKYSKL